MTQSTAAAPPRDRLAPWIQSLGTRREALNLDVSAPVATVIGQLSAMHDLDGDRLRATLTDDLIVRVWGWTNGGRWTFEGTDAHTAIRSWLAAQGDTVVTMRGDIDRFFPGTDALGIDGVWSWLRREASGDVLHIAARRFAWFGTYRNSALSVMDLYWDVHESIGVSDRL